MDAELMLDVGQANEFKLACRRAGYTNADVKKLCEGDLLLRLLPVIRGYADVPHVIDCDVDPIIPNKGWRVEEHRKSGRFTWDPTKISLYLSKRQYGEKHIKGHKLRQELANKPALNANVLDYLLAHPYLIPEEWKVDKQGNLRYIYFWGTIYQGTDGGLCVRCMCLENWRWSWSYDWLDYSWHLRLPAALRAN